MKKSTFALAIFAALSAAPAIAAEPTPDFTFTGNVNVLTDYRFRGISQTARGPALQGGFDVAHKSGFYAGNWNSNVSSNSFANGGGLEMDFYAGYKGEFKGVGFDVGNLYYYYDGARYAGSNKTYDNNEVYVGLSHGPFSGKYSYATTDYFGLSSQAGFVDSNGNQVTSRSRGSSYTELNFSKEVAPKVTLNAHVGYTDVKNYKDLSYTDYKLGASYDLNGFALGAHYVGTDVSGATAEGFYSVVNGTGPKQLYKDTIVLSVGKTF
jgi:uncharacterized protein (TIGR02001 family)